MRESNNQENVDIRTKPPRQDTTLRYIHALLYAALNPSMSRPSIRAVLREIYLAGCRSRACAILAAPSKMHAAPARPTHACHAVSGRVGAFRIQSRRPIRCFGVAPAQCLPRTCTSLLPVDEFCLIGRQHGIARSMCVPWMPTRLGILPGRAKLLTGLKNLAC